MLDAAGLWDFALKSAGARAQTLGEIRAKLKRRAEREEDVDATLAKLKEYRFLDDGKFAETFAANRLEAQGLGKQRAIRDLRGRLVSATLAEQAVERVYAGQDETALIEEFIRRKYKNADREKLFDNAKDLASAYRRLRVAGFQTGNAVRVLKRFAANPELLDGIQEELDGVQEEEE